jgi:hypothetical protein
MIGQMTFFPNLFMAATGCSNTEVFVPFITTFDDCNVSFKIRGMQSSKKRHNRYPSLMEVSIVLKNCFKCIHSPQLKCMVEVRRTKDKGYGLFCIAAHIPKGTRIAEFSGTKINCVDEYDNVIRNKPTGIYVIQCDVAGSKFLDAASNPKYGEFRYDEAPGHFMNSSHPCLEPPFDESNCIIECGPDEFDCCAVTAKDVYFGDELLVDYHHQLTKLKIARSCGCHECEMALRSPSWPNRGDGCDVTPGLIQAGAASYV